MDTTDTLLSIDPSLRGTGFAVLQRTGSKVRCLEFGVIRNAPKLPITGCLVEIHRRLGEAIDAHAPQAVAMESVIYVQSLPTAITLGSARGAALLAAAQRGLPVHEYAPRRIKQAVVGRGAAQKEQVAFMIRALLGLTVTPPPDAADAIAVGLTHFQTADGAARRGQSIPHL
ncbi:MAG: crossover junction endodeoxyribonuclease RuvC [Terrimicrobiaceae bacterium]|nr:crossover junction endodeoxyribonuclease RuvC [Terrimicrobiaceae bacterium]